MKKFGIFLLVWLLSLLSIIQPVLAQSEDCENPIPALYTVKNDEKYAQTSSEFGDNLKVTGTGSTSRWVDTEGILNGLTIIPDCNPIKQSVLQRNPHLAYGLTQNTGGLMLNAFLNSPTNNIPVFYAQMLLPKEIWQQGGGTALAQRTEPPNGESATVYLGSDGLGMNRLWSISFTLAMGILVVILIIAGFMIMFRSKAGGQVVVTISMALQNAIIGAFLALASYAIGSFFLNFSKYLVLVVAFFFQDIFNDYGIDVIYINGPWNLFRDFIGTTVWGTLHSDITSWWKMAGDSIVGSALGITEDMPEAFQKVFVHFSAYTAGTTVTLLTIMVRTIISGALLITTLRIFWVVLSTYIKMVIDIVLAPLLLMISSLPGKQSGFNTWLSRMFKNSITIPIMFAFVNVAAYMAYAVATSSAGCAGEGKSILTCITGGMIPSGAATMTDNFMAIVGPSAVVALVMLNMVPTVPIMVQEMFNPKGGDISKAWDGAKKTLQSTPVIGGLFQ